MSLRLYYAPHTRAARARWMLEEAGLPYELVRVDMSKREHKAAEYLGIHPHGRVPALVDGTTAIHESAALCMYIADKVPEKALAPKVGTMDRGVYYQWMVYSVATLEEPLLKVFLHTQRLSEAKRIASVADEGRDQWRAIAKVVTDAIEGKTFLVGNQFTAADVMIGSGLIWAEFMGLLDDQKTLQVYSARLRGRPAYQRASAD